MIPIVKHPSTTAFVNLTFINFLISFLGGSSDMIIYLYFSFIRFNVLNVTAVTKPFKASPAIVNIYLSYPLHIRGKVLGFETFFRS